MPLDTPATSFIPGPWSIATYSKSPTKSFTEHYIEAPLNGRRACIVVGDSDEKIATARLIAAAPTLYEALRALVAKHDRPHGFEDAPWYAPEIEAARDALEAALGGER